MHTTQHSAIYVAGCGKKKTLLLQCHFKRFPVARQSGCETQVSVGNSEATKSLKGEEVPEIYAYYLHSFGSQRLLFPVLCSSFHRILRECFLISLFFFPPFPPAMHVSYRSSTHTDPWGQSKSGWGEMKMPKMFVTFVNVMGLKHVAE